MKDSYGYKTIGIPGVVAGLLKLQDHGKLDLETVMKLKQHICCRKWISNITWRN